jgi:predicted ATPase
MANISRLRVENFKSFANLEIELKNLEILVGANASGKSNFLQIFQFYRDIVKEGLESAVSLQGGIEYVRNVQLGAKTNTLFEIVSQSGRRLMMHSSGKKLVGLETRSINCKFELGFVKARNSFRVLQDSVVQSLELTALEPKTHKEISKIGDVQIEFTRKGGRLETRAQIPNGSPIKETDFVPPFVKQTKLSERELILHRIPQSWWFPWAIGDIAIYDFAPKLAKRSTPYRSRAELEPDGSNLALVLERIWVDTQKRRKLLNLLGEILPFVKKIGVRHLEDKSVLLRLKETYSEKGYMPAASLSDGTIYAAAIIVALYFEREAVTIVEEPERGIHPALISRLIGMLSDAATRRQVIVTTHSPEVLKNARPENVVFFYRDADGFSQCCRPAGRPEIEEMLGKEFGMDKLLLHDLLGHSA